MTRRIQLARAVGGALVFLTGLFLFVKTAWPHGSESEVRLLGQRAGAYDVTVRIAPKQLRIGVLHVEVQLIDPEALSYVDGATVTAVARTRDGTGVEAGPVRSRYREPWHEMDLSLTKSGPWDVHLTIDGALGREDVSFRVDVRPKKNGTAGLIRVPEIGAFLDAQRRTSSVEPT